MTPEKREELRRLAEKATPGPWQHFGEWDTQHAVTAQTQMVCSTLHGNDEANARFIAAANPAAVLDLLAYVDDRNHVISELEKNRDANVDIVARRETALLAEINGLRAEHDEDQGVIRVWRGRTERAESERDALKAENERLRAEIRQMKEDAQNAAWERSEHDE